MVKSSNTGKVSTRVAFAIRAFPVILSLLKRCALKPRASSRLGSTPHYAVSPIIIPFQVLTEYILPVAMDGDGQGASHASVRDGVANALQPILPVSVLTYVEDRLYLASYTSPPTPDTLFPYPTELSAKRSPTKRSSKAIDGPTLVSKKERTPPCYFCVDDTLLYNAFHHDFGPFHIGHLYRFAVYLHDILGAPENQDRPVVFWSKADARSEKFIYNLETFSELTNTVCSRSGQRRLYTCLLYGFDTILATSPRTCANCTSRPTAHAIQRCRV